MNTPTINKKNSKKTQKVTKTLSHEPLSEEEHLDLVDQYREELQSKRYIYNTLNEIIRYLTLFFVPIMILLKYRFIGIIVIIFYYIMLFFISFTSFLPYTSVKIGNYVQYTILYFTLLAIIYRFTPTP